MNADEMKERTMCYALRIIKVMRSLRRDVECDIIGRQLLRAGTSVAANYRAACRARSRAEFIAKMGIVEEECDESLFWMELLIRSKILTEAKLKNLMNEGNEIAAIVVSSKKTARSRAKKKDSR